MIIGPKTLWTHEKHDHQSLLQVWLLRLRGGLLHAQHKGGTCWKATNKPGSGPTMLDAQLNYLCHLNLALCILQQHPSNKGI